MCAVPKRLPVLWAKAAVYGLVTLALMLPATLIAFFVGQAFLHRQHINIAFSHPGVARAVIGAALYLVVVGIFGLGLGAITRNTAGGIATFAAIMFVLPPLMNVLPSSWNHAASPYLPLAAGEAIMSITPGDHLSPWVGLALFTRLRRRSHRCRGGADRPSRRLAVTRRRATASRGAGRHCRRREDLGTGMSRTVSVLRSRGDRVTMGTGPESRE